MKQAVWLLATLVAATPAAAWDLSSSDTKKSWSYAAFQQDKAGAAELQFYCDDSDPEDIQMLVFTDLDAQDGDADFPSVSVDAIVDSVTFADLAGYYDEVDGERTVVIDTSEEQRILEVIDAARQARAPLQIAYDGRSHRFGVDGISEVLSGFSEGCRR